MCKHKISSRAQSATIKRSCDILSGTHCTTPWRKSERGRECMRTRSMVSFPALALQSIFPFTCSFYTQGPLGHLVWDPREREREFILPLKLKKPSSTGFSILSSFFHGSKGEGKCREKKGFSQFFGGEMLIKYFGVPSQHLSFLKGRNVPK